MAVPSRSCRVRERRSDYRSLYRGSRRTEDGCSRVTTASPCSVFFFFFQAEDGIRDYKVTGVQTCALPILVADPRANLDKAVRRVKEAAAGGATLVCLPELFRTLYIGQREDHALFDLAEPVPGPTTDALGAVARQLGVVIVAPLFERRAPGLYHNTAAVIDANGQVAGIYRKMHIPDDPAYYEKFYFTPGDLGFKAFDTAVGRVGTLVCWDQWYPEAARLTALQGASILCYPTAIGWHPAEKAQYGPQ